MLESNAPKELILHFVRDVGRADLAKGFENNAKSELPALKERIGTIKGDDSARALVSIWLGPRPPSADLKTGLLGGQCG